MSTTPVTTSDSGITSGTSDSGISGTLDTAREHKMLRPSTFWKIHEELPRQVAGALMGISMFIPFVLWWLLSASGQVSPLFLPSPPQVWEAFVRLLAEGTLFTDITYSLMRVLGGFLAAALISIPLGIAMGTFPNVRALTEPIMGTLRYMPAPAFIPLLILYLGLDEMTKIALIFIGTLFFNTLMVMDAAKAVPKELIEATYTLGGQRHQIVVQVITPYILPQIIDACRVNMAASWNLVIVSELVAATEGLGRRISVAQRYLKTDEIFVGLLVIGLIGLTIDLLFLLLGRIACRWAE